MTPLELAANAVNVLSVLLAAYNRVLTWPVGIAGCVLYGVMFYEQKLYADVTLQVFFTVTSFMGWYNWRFGGECRTEHPVMRLAPIRLTAWCAGAIAGGLSYGWVLSRWTDASYPYSDSLILSFSVAAQILLLERVAENWLGWIVVNTIATPLYCAKGLYLTSFVYAAFWLNAVWGHRQWRLIAERSAVLPKGEQ